MVRQQLKQQTGFHLFDQVKKLTLSGYQQLVKLNTDIFIRSLCLQATFAL